jgi:uncharacterized protein YprB with RNaseH-like and TPR domain
MVKTMDDSIALVKITVKYELYGKRHSLMTTLTPLEYSSCFPFEDQYDFIAIAIEATDVKWYDLETEELDEFRDSLVVKVMHNPSLDISLN